jgi:rRNA maturation protein Nop10
MTYPQWICHDCGMKYGRRACGIATWHIGICNVCGKKSEVTEPRDFAHLKDGWQHHIANAGKMIGEGND